MCRLALNIGLGGLPAGCSHARLTCARYGQTLRREHENWFSGAQDAAQRPGLSERTTNVYAECFSRFRHVAGSLGGAQLCTLAPDGPPVAALQPDCASRGEGKHCPEGMKITFCPAGRRCATARTLQLDCKYVRRVLLQVQRRRRAIARRLASTLLPEGCRQGCARPHYTVQTMTNSARYCVRGTSRGWLPT